MEPLALTLPLCYRVSLKDISNTEKARDWANRLNDTPEREEILDHMKKMKESAPGKDGVRIIYKLQGGPEIFERVVNMVQMMFEKGAEEWEELLKIGQVISLHKKGDRNNPNNFRGVFLLAMGSRIQARIISNRLRIWSEDMELVDDNQADFRKDRSIADITHMMVRIQEDTRDWFKRVETRGGRIEDQEKPAARLLDLRGQANQLC